MSHSATTSMNENKLICFRNYYRENKGQIEATIKRIKALQAQYDKLISQKNTDQVDSPSLKKLCHEIAKSLEISNSVMKVLVQFSKLLEDSIHEKTVPDALNQNKDSLSQAYKISTDAFSTHEKDIYELLVTCMSADEKNKTRNDNLIQKVKALDHDHYLLSYYIYHVHQDINNLVPKIKQIKSTLSSMRQSCDNIDTTFNKLKIYFLKLQLVCNSDVAKATNIYRDILKDTNLIIDKSGQLSSAECEDKIQALIKFNKKNHFHELTTIQNHIESATQRLQIKINEQANEQLTPLKNTLTEKASALRNFINSMGNTDSQAYISQYNQIINILKNDLAPNNNSISYNPIEIVTNSLNLISAAFVQFFDGVDFRILLDDIKPDNISHLSPIEFQKTFTSRIAAITKAITELDKLHNQIETFNQAQKSKNTDDKLPSYSQKYPTGVKKSTDTKSNSTDFGLTNTTPISHQTNNLSPKHPFDFGARESILAKTNSSFSITLSAEKNTTVTANVNSNVVLNANESAPPINREQTKRLVKERLAYLDQLDSATKGKKSDDTPTRLITQKEINKNPILLVKKFISALLIKVIINVNQTAKEVLKESSPAPKNNNEELNESTKPPIHTPPIRTKTSKEITNIEPHRKVTAAIDNINTVMQPHINQVRMYREDLESFVRDIEKHLKQFKNAGVLDNQSEAALINIKSKIESRIPILNNAKITHYLDGKYISHAKRIIIADRAVHNTTDNIGQAISEAVSERGWLNRIIDSVISYPKMIIFKFFGNNNDGTDTIRNEQHHSIISSIRSLWNQVTNISTPSAYIDQLHDQFNHLQFNTLANIENYSQHLNKLKNTIVEYTLKQAQTVNHSHNLTSTKNNGNNVRNQQPARITSIGHYFISQAFTSTFFKQTTQVDNSAKYDLSQTRDVCADELVMDEIPENDTSIPTNPHNNSY